MISRIEGELIAINAGRAEINCGPLTYELLLPACDVSMLSTHIGETVCFHTLHYFEGQGQGTTLTPRLIGFQSRDAVGFFELFTTVKGIGNRKALRALELPLPRIAQAIAERDVDLLKSLPEIGKRTADSIVTELSGKVDRFIELKPMTGDHISAGGGQAGVSDDARDAVLLMVELGESKHQATQLVERVLAADPTLTSTQNILAAALRLRSSPM